MILKIMKRHLQFKIYLVLMTLLLCHDTWGQETKISKSIDKSFEVSDRLNLEITNKYGSVIIDTWDKNEVSLKIEILAYGKDNESAEKLMDRVEFDFKQSIDFLEVESVFDRRKSFFKDMMNAIGDYSASLLSKHKLQVNYELIIPESSASVTLDNRFGDIHLGDIEGRLNITIAHGNLRVDKIGDFSRINVNYGNAKIREVSEINISVKGGELELDQVQKLNLQSSSSSINIGKVTVMDIESTNDKISIGEVRDISGSAEFSEIKVDYFSELCRLNQNYGGLTIKNVLDSFQSIRLSGKSTDYNLKFDKNSSFDANIYARDDKLKITEFPGKREKRYMDEKSKFVQINGYFGAAKVERKVSVDAQNGEVSIDFIDVLSETYNK